MQKRKPGRPKGSTKPVSEKKVPYTHRFRPREHEWIKNNRTFIEIWALKRNE